MNAATQPLNDQIRRDWSRDEVEALFALPFNDLLFRAQTVHRQHFDPNQVQVSTLLSIKTGRCPEDCKYCPQSSRYDTELESEKLLRIEAVLEKARAAKSIGSTRFCMGAAWRSPKPKDMPLVTDMVRQVRDMGMETCMTLGMLNEGQAKELADAGLDYYNHNLDTSPEYYCSIITTRTYQDRLDTLDNVRNAGIKVCSGGIVGMGETENDRAGLLVALANMPQQPDSVPINRLVRVKGTPMEDGEDIDGFDFVRTIAVARILMPKSHVRLSAGRETMSEELQSMCFFAGANSIFYGEKLLTTANPDADSDRDLFIKLGIQPEPFKTDESADSGNIANDVSQNLFYDAAG